MAKRDFILILTAVLISLSIPVTSGSGNDVAFPDKTGNTNVFTSGEELVYNVRYGFISLGKITVTINGPKEEDGEAVFLANADIASYSGVPFVSLHHIYSSEIKEQFYSMWFESREKKRDDWELMRFKFDYDQMEVEIEEGMEGFVEVTDTLVISDYLQDGLSIFYFARGFSGSNEELSIPVMINKDIVTTDFDFNGRRRSIKSKAVDYPVDVVELRGRANFSGIFGMTGAFRGWFTNDDAAIPIEAKLRVLIGNVTVELIEWNRPGWSPPKYTSNS